MAGGAEHLASALGTLAPDVAVTTIVADGDDLDTYLGGPATAATVYEGGSLGKTITAYLLASAVRDGLISLDTRVNHVLPADWRLVQRDAATVGELATHTSGIQRSVPGQVSMTAWADDPWAPYDEADAGWILSQAKFRKPGRFRYSNLGFIILGLVVQRCYESPLADVASRLVLEPAGLSRSGYQSEDPMGSDLAPPHNARGAIVKPWSFNSLIQGAALPVIAPVDAIAWLEFVKRTDAGRLCVEPRAHSSRGRHVALSWMLYGGASIALHTGGTGGTRGIIATRLDKDRSVYAFVGQAVSPLKFHRLRRRTLVMLSDDWEVSP